MKSYYKYKKFYFVFLMTILILSLSGCSDSGSGNIGDTTTYPISSDVQTTRQRAIVPDSISSSNTIYPWEISKFKENGYGTWHYVSGIDAGKQTDLMPAGYSSTSVTNSARLLNFFTITDIHLVDKESPTRSVYLAIKDYNSIPVSSIYSPVMLYSTHVLDAAIQTVNALHKQKSFDCGISLGDTCDNTDAYVSETNLFAKLHTYPNLTMWISGHRHKSVVTPFKSPDPNHPELGFWEIETPSLRDFPQQFRTFEIVRNSDNNISIIVTDVDPAVRDGAPAAISRSYGVAAQQIYKSNLPQLPTVVYNAELIKQLSPEMQAKIQNYGTPIGK